MTAKTAASSRDLTSGSLHRAIWYLAVPMILEMGVLNVWQVLDTLWIGRLGTAALAAITISASIRWVINSVANGLGSGGLAVVARRVGGREEEAAAHAAWQTILLGTVISLLLGILGLVLARPALLLMGADATVLPLGLAYMRITMCGMFTLVLTFVINSILRGAGEARWAMIVLFVATAVTILTEWILVFGMGPVPALGIAGSAWGGVLGFGAAVVLQLAVLLSGRARIHLTLGSLRLDLPLMWRILRISLPSMVQMFLRTSSSLVILGLVGVYGTAATAGYGVANRMLMLVIIPAFGLSNSAGTLVGQNLGAHKPGRAEQNAWWVSLYTAIYAAVAGLLLWIAAGPIIGVFDPTPQVVDYGATCLRIMAPSIFLYAVGTVLGRAFVGAGDPVPPMVVNLLSLWLIAVPFAFGLSRWLGMGLDGILWGLAIAYVANGLLLIFWFRRGRWKLREV